MRGTDSSIVLDHSSSSVAASNMASFPLSYTPNMIKPWAPGEGRRSAHANSMGEDVGSGEFKVHRTLAGLSSLLKSLHPIQVSAAAQEKMAGECKKPSHSPEGAQLCRILKLVSSQRGHSVLLRGASVWVRPRQNAQLLCPSDGWIRPLLKVSIWSNASLKAICFYARNNGLVQ